MKSPFLSSRKRKSHDISINDEKNIALKEVRQKVEQKREEQIQIDQLITTFSSFISDHSSMIQWQSNLQGIISLFTSQPTAIHDMAKTELRIFMDEMKQFCLRYDIDLFRRFVNEILPFAEVWNVADDKNQTFITSFHKQNQIEPLAFSLHSSSRSVGKRKVVEEDDAWLTVSAEESQFSQTKHCFPRICNIIMKEFNSLQRYSLFHLSNSYFNYSKTSEADKAYYQELADHYNDPDYYSGEFFGVTSNEVFQKRNIMTEYSQKNHGVINGYHFHHILHVTIAKYYELQRRYHLKVQTFLKYNSFENGIEEFLDENAHYLEGLTFAAFAKDYCDVLYLHASLEFRNEIPKLKIKVLSKERIDSSPDEEEAENPPVVSDQPTDSLLEITNKRLSNHEVNDDLYWHDNDIESGKNKLKVPREEGRSAEGNEFDYEVDDEMIFDECTNDTGFATISTLQSIEPEE